MTAGKSHKNEPIAIVGMACRMPGGVKDISGLWEFLREQKDVHQEFTEPRFSASGFYHPNPDRPGTAAASHGFLLEEDPRLFDPAFFGITDLEAETLDASQRKLLEVTYEAFENAGETWESVSGARIGVFVGDICFDNYVSQTRDWDYGGKYSATGAFPNMLANRIHYIFNLKGPSLLLNSACTSAMYALHLAITSMRNGDCDSAIVAGSNWIMDPNCHIAMGKLGALSATSRSHTFDASADGYARGEGFAALYLKTSSAAVRDASPIRALIRGSAVNANGRTSGITNPSGAAQEIVIREAYKNAGGLEPSETMLLECHGTGTRVGDPIEVMAAGNVFGPGRPDGYEDRLIVGSVKTNMGHLEGACALPGILKVVTALEAGEIPPTLGFKTPNPRIDFDKAKARVVTNVEPWPKNKIRRAGVTSAGFGGTNGHCIIDHVHNLMPDYVKPGIIEQCPGDPNGARSIDEIHETIVNGTNGTNGSASRQLLHAPVVDEPTMVRKADAPTRQFVVLPFSAHNKASLSANVGALLGVLHQHSLADVAYTLAAKRSRFSHRTFCIVDKDESAQTLSEHNDGLRAFSSPQHVNVGFVFTGQGAQWHGMGAELLEYAVFRDAILYMDRVLESLPEPASWKVFDVISGNCSEDFVQSPSVSQTVCTALQVGLVDLLASWSVRPVGVAGHSSGEMAAAYAAGRITAAEAITAAYYRGYAVSFNKQNGSMLAAGLGFDKGVEYIKNSGLEGKVKVAAINSPDSITISGDTAAITELSKTLSQENVFNRVLRTGGLAYHSHHMLPLGHDYAKALENGLQRLEKLGASTKSQKYPFIPWVSSVTPDKSTTLSPENAVSYWKSNLESPVRFTEAVSNLVNLDDLSIGALVEIGPHPALKSPLAQIVNSLGKNIPHVASLKRREDARTSLLDLAGTLFSLNADINLVAVNAVDKQIGKRSEGLVHGCTAIDLPPYQYTYGPIKYYESRISKQYRLRKVPRHDLLGSKVAGTTRLRPQWRNIIRLKDLPWLNDHRVPPHVLHPGAAHIAMAMVAAEKAYAELPGALPITGLKLRNVSIKKTLVVPQDDHGIEIVLSMEFDDNATAKAPGWASFSIASVVRDSDQWTEHCSGLISVEVSAFEQAPPIDTTMDGRAVDAQTWYTRFADMGLQFGPSFQGYSDIYADPAKNVAKAKLALNTTAGMFPGGESSYPIHPASLDLVIRLGLMACNGGQAETASVQLPIHFNQMRFNYGHIQGRDWVTGVSRGELRGLRGAYAQLQLVDETGNVIMDVDNMRFTSLNNEQQSPSNAGQSSIDYASPFTRLVWRPDIRTMSKKQYSALLSPPGEKGGLVRKLCDVFDLMGHANPGLRVLELNASEDAGTARAVLKTLSGPNGIKCYREYVLADISEEHLKPVRETTPEFRDISYSVLDIETDPLQQGFQAGTYDTILWPTTTNAPKSIRQALANCRTLLKPNGSLILVKQTEEKTNGASLDSTSWDGIFQEEGFESAAALMDDTGEVRNHETIILTTLKNTNRQRDTVNPVVHLLHGTSGVPSLLKCLAQAMEGRGLSTRTVPLDNAREVLAPNSHVVAFLDGENLLMSADQHRLDLFQHLAANTASMVWITSCGLIKGRNPDGAFVTGLLRTLGAENPAGQFLSVDIDAEDFRVSEEDVRELVSCLVDQELALQEALGDSDEIEVNREVAWQDGCMWVSRIVPDAHLQGYAKTATTLNNHEAKMVSLVNQGPVRADFETPGILTSLYFRPYTELWKPLPCDWIEVKVEAVGLNWKDLGLCSGRFDQNNLSNEYCGVVTKAGSNVSNLQVGDRVYGMGKGHFGNYTHVPAALAQKLRPDASAFEAATMPLVFMTAVYAFEYVTRLRKGQTVLIQSASGGLGLAAVQLALSKSADVFVTAGTPEKARFLIEKMGIPSDHVFSSRNSADLMRMVPVTKNGGFDVILSTAQGDMLYESIKALAPLGHLIDVGRLDVTSSKTIALELFQKSASFTSFDLGLVVDSDITLGGELMRAVNEHHRAGRIGPIRPYTVSDISQLDQVLLGFSKGTHIGKMVISYQDPSSTIRMLQSAPPAHFEPDARYVLVGGLTGLGRSIVRWMCDRGARNLIIWSRRGASNLSPEAVSLVDELTAQGVRIKLVACDVSNREQVLQAMKDASSDGTVRGVFNYAVSYQDISFDKMTQEKFHQGMAAKVLGTKYLHEATASLPLDFFVMTSSFGTVYAFPTQSTYLAANNFLDYFARYRRRCGLPASTVSLGFISDLGALTQDPVTVGLFVRAKGQTVTGSQVIRMLEPAFVPNQYESHQQWFGRLQDPLSEANIVTGIDPAVLAIMRREEAKTAKTSASGSAPRWYHDARVALMLRALDDAWRYRNGDGGSRTSQDAEGAGEQSPTALLRRQFEVAVDKIRDLNGEERKKKYVETVAFVMEAIKVSVAEMLFVDPSAVNATSTVADHGIDSLLAAEFRNWLHVAFGKNISMLDLMDSSTKINTLAQSVVDDAVGI
ncbi:polyketide synthase [Biscogniauxia sp. FL1348]|nr:polyketide synthase [Biscogniauxia sp. FL1348]